MNPTDPQHAFSSETRPECFPMSCCLLHVVWTDLHSAWLRSFKSLDPMWGQVPSTFTTDPEAASACTLVRGHAHLTCGILQSFLGALHPLNLFLETVLTLSIEWPLGKLDFTCFCTNLHGFSLRGGRRAVTEVRLQILPPLSLSFTPLQGRGFPYKHTRLSSPCRVHLIGSGFFPGTFSPHHPHICSAEDVGMKSINGRSSDLPSGAYHSLRLLGSCCLDLCPQHASHAETLALAGSWVVRTGPPTEKARLSLASRRSPPA